MRRRQFQFSLRVLLLATSCGAVLLAICASCANGARKQARGVAWVLSQGGHVRYAYQGPLADGSYLINAKPPVSDFLRQVLGIDYFSSVTGVVLDRDEIHNLEPLNDFPNLRSLALFNFVLPQTDFSSLRHLKCLDTLYLGYTGIDEHRTQKIKQIVPKCQIKHLEL